MNPLPIHRYRLRLLLAGNALSTRAVLDGFLLRCGDGFGCVHPWPELGDPTVEELLVMLRDGRRHRLLERALYCAQEDGAARQAGRSLFCSGGFQPSGGMIEGWGAGSPRYIPRSHATITGDADFPALAAAGFRTVKLKTAGADEGIVERTRAALEAGLWVRIDCNGTGISALRALRSLAEQVEFIEDPEPYAAVRWREIRKELGIPLALDRLEGADAGGYDVRVIKPALETCEARGVPVVFTSYMDHPLGQMWAALEAARYEGTQLEAGLLTHTLFEPDAFTEAVQTIGPQLLPPGGTGLGFDALLEALPWERLSGSAPLTVLNPEPWEAADFWEQSTPLLLTNPRAPLDDPPRELPDGCLVFPTSGSSGFPSLVCLTRTALLANAAAVNDWLSATADDVWLRVLPVFHVGGLSISARGFLSGSRVVSDEEKWNPQRFAVILQRDGITLTSLVPSQVYDLVTARLAAPSPLRAVIVGGGSLEASLFEKARTLGWPLLPSYGMTEASSQVATATMDSLNRLPPGTGGSPLELLPCWEPRVNEGGRLQLRGAPLLSGRYIRSGGDWEFQEAIDADGWFTTSDRALLDGRILTPLGRCDRVVKILGELVNLDFIEAALAAAGMPPDRGAVVALPDDRAGARPLLITELGESEARDFTAMANAVLPPFAGISDVRLVQKLPRSPLGKILRAEVEAMLTTRG